MTKPKIDAIAGSRRLLARFGPVAVVLALAVATTSFLIFSEYTPVRTTPSVVLGLFIANITTILALAVLVVLEGWTLVAAWKAGVAGARLHLRIVGLFSIIAAVPVILMALVGSITLDRSLNPAFMQDVRGFVQNTIQAATLYREAQCRSLLQETRLTAKDLDSAKAFLTADRAILRDYFASRAKFLGFSAAALLKPDGTMIERVDMVDSRLGAHGERRSSNLSKAGFHRCQEANEPLCLLLDRRRADFRGAHGPMGSVSRHVPLRGAAGRFSFTIEFPQGSQAASSCSTTPSTATATSDLDRLRHHVCVDRADHAPVRRPGSACPSPTA